jgi:hypothetical protein
MREAINGVREAGLMREAINGFLEACLMREAINGVREAGLMREAINGVREARLGCPDEGGDEPRLHHSVRLGTRKSSSGGGGSVDGLRLGGECMRRMEHDDG